VETTALVVRALAGAQKTVAADSGALINQALLFLFRSKDRFGVWHSTQATVNALDAITTVVGKADPGTGSGSMEILVNGRVVNSTSIPRTAQPVDAITLDLSSFISAGPNAGESRCRNESETGPFRGEVMAALYRSARAARGGLEAVLSH
jgi:hypothetical protein